MNRELGSFLSQQIGRGEQEFDGELVAPLVDEFDAVRSMIGSFQGGQSQDQQRSAVNRALSGEPSFQVGTEESERVFRESVLGPSLQAFDEEIAPRINAAFAGQGGTFSSRRGLAHQNALEDIFNQAQSDLAGFVREDRNLAAQLNESAANRSLQGIGLASQLDIQPLEQAMTFAQSLSPFQTFEQQQRDAQFQEFMRTLPSRNPLLDLAVPFGTARTRQAVTQGQIAPAEAYGEIAGTAIGAVMGSSRRFKYVFGPTDVDPRQALEALTETPIYDWTYKGEDHRRTGVVSDEPSDMPWMAGETFDPLTAFGYTVQAIKALQEEIQELRDEIGA